MSNDLLIVLSMVPDRETAERIAGTVVEEQLAACVNIIPGITSVYHWKEKLEKDDELLLIIKTGEDSYDSLEQRIRELHSYELPEIIAVSLHTAQEDYAKWLLGSLKSK